MRHLGNSFRANNCHSGVLTPIHCREIPLLLPLGGVPIGRLGMGTRVLWLMIAAACCMPGSAWAGEPFTIIDAIKQAVQTNPAVGEASANRRATEADMHTSQGVL